MSCEPILSVHNLKKNFRLYKHNRHRLYELLTGKCLHRNFTALKDISFTLEPGKVLGIVGENGSGKSTLLKLMIGILIPDEGTIIRHGNIAGLLELGTGFNPEISGRRNIYLNGMYLNIPREELESLENNIVEFSELGPFIDEPLKNYSSGMIMRLAFSIGIHARPQCFLIDEALSVGDIRFQHKCFDRLKNFRSAGGSIIFVSHDMNAVKLLCDNAILLHHGEIRHYGIPDDVVNMFNELMAEKGESGIETGTGYGNNLVHFSTAEILDQNGNPSAAITAGDPMIIHFTWDCQQPVKDVTFGFTIRDKYGQDVFGTNGALLGVLANVTEAGEGWFHIKETNIGPGKYTINMAAHTGTTHLEHCFHWWDNAAAFEVVHGPVYFGGHTKLAATLELDKGQKNIGYEKIL